MPIPSSLRKELCTDSFMETCCYKSCKQPPEWHHVFQYGKSQIQEAFNIVPACKKHHDQATPHKQGYKQEVREYFEWIALNRMTFEDLHKYPKKNWAQLISYLKIKYDK